jgi:hypothetical protein
MATPIRLHKVDACDEIGIIPVNRNILARALAFEARHLRGLDEDRLDRKFLPQLALPLIAKMGGREHGQAPCDAPIQQLAGDHSGFDSLADANVVRDQQPHRIEPQSHDQRHELVRARGDRYPAERTESGCAGAEAEAGGVEQRHHTGGIARPRRRRRQEFSGRDVPAFQWQIDADFVGLALGQWPQVQDAWFTRRQDNPVTPSRPNQRSGREPALHYQPLLNPILKGSQ